MCKTPSAPAPEPVVEIKKPTQANAEATKSSAIENNRAALAGRDITTSSRGLEDSAKSKRKTLLGE